eukprot:gene22042-biopygen7743
MRLGNGRVAMVHEHPDRVVRERKGSGEHINRLFATCQNFDKRGGNVERWAGVKKFDWLRHLKLLTPSSRPSDLSVSVSLDIYVYTRLVFSTRMLFHSTNMGLLFIGEPTLRQNGAGCPGPLANLAH